MITIPSGWNSVRARFVFRRRDVRGVDAPLASATKEGVSLRADLDFSVWNPDSDVSSYKLVEPEDFVVGLRSFQHGISHSDVRGIVSPAYTVLRAVEGVEPRFYKHYFRSKFLISQLANIAQGIRQGQAIDMEEFANLHIPIPPLKEQCRVADFLDAETARIDRVNRIRETQISLVDTRVRAFRDGRVAELFLECGVLPLRRFVRTIEQGASPRCDAVPAAEGEWGVLKLSSVKRGEFIAGENKRLPDGILPTRAHEVRPGDLLVTRANTPELVGDTAVASSGVTRLLLPDLIYRVSLNSGTSAEFIAQVALSDRIRSLIQAVARGSSQTMVKLRGEDIRAWPIPVTSAAGQRKFVQEMDEVVSVAARMRRLLFTQRELLDERRQALVTAAVTGQIDMSTASGRGVEA